MAGKKPDFELMLASKDDNPKRYSGVGKGWALGSGGVSIQLNPGVVLDWRMNDDFWINLNPIGAEASAPVERKPKPRKMRWDPDAKRRVPVEDEQDEPWAMGCEVDDA